MEVPEAIIPFGAGSTQPLACAGDLAGRETINLEVAQCIVEMNLYLVTGIASWAGQFLNPFDARATLLTWLIDVTLMGVAFAVVRRLIGLVRG